MKAVLSIPAWCREDQRYAPLRDPQILTELGRQIARSLRPSALIYQVIPTEVPVEVVWIPDDTNPQLAEPLLIVEVEGTSATPQRESVNQAGYRLGRAMTDSHLAAIIPDCQIRLRVVSEHTVPIGG